MTQKKWSIIILYKPKLSPRCILDSNCFSLVKSKSIILLLRVSLFINCKN